MWIISFMGETWSIIVCMLCTRVASLQRSTLHISNWKNIFFKGGKECYNWEWLESGCWLMADQRCVKIVGCITVCFMGWWMILCQCWSLLMLNLKCRFPNPEKKSTLSKCIVRSISGTQHPLYMSRVPMDISPQILAGGHMVTAWTLFPDLKSVPICTFHSWTGKPVL